MPFINVIFFLRKSPRRERVFRVYHPPNAVLSLCPQGDLNKYAQSKYSCKNKEKEREVAVTHPIIRFFFLCSSTSSSALLDSRFMGTRNAEREHTFLAQHYIFVTKYNTQVCLPAVVIKGGSEGKTKSCERRDPVFPVDFEGKFNQLNEHKCGKRAPPRRPLASWLTRFFEESMAPLLLQFTSPMAPPIDYTTPVVRNAISARFQDYGRVPPFTTKLTTGTRPLGLER